jgi:hypothetical protein
MANTQARTLTVARTSHQQPHLGPGEAIQDRLPVMQSPKRSVHLPKEFAR